MLEACYRGDLSEARARVIANSDLVRCEYNYMPPLHLAVREGHLELVRYLLDQGAFDPKYVTYPYNETLLTMAEDRDFTAIATLLQEYNNRPRPVHTETKSVHGAGSIMFPQDDLRVQFEKLVAANALRAVEKLLERHPELIHDPYAAWSEGILSVPANRRLKDMMELLLRFGARVPDVAKWGRAYYLKHREVAAFLLERGMHPNHMNWHRTTLLHDMMWEGDLPKARLVLDHGADIDAIDDEFQSTPLGLAVRWGRRDLVKLLLGCGADPDRSGAPWATPLAWARKKGHRTIEADLRQAGAVD
jgi:ankyrin repeat protein